MKLSSKLSVAQSCLISAILVAYAIFQFTQEVRLYEQDMIRDHHVTGVTLRTALIDLWRHGDRGQAAAMIADADASHSGMDVQWIPLDPSVAPGAASPVGPAGAKAGWIDLLRRGQEVVRIEPGTDGGRERVTYIPVSPDGSVLGAIRISESLAEERRFAQGAILHILVTTTIIAGSGVLISFLLGARWIMRPMEGLISQARRIGAGDLSQRAPVRGHDEISDLSLEMNQMADQLEDSRRRLMSESDARIATLDQLRHADRLAMVGTLASGIAHELGTPLNVVTARARLIETGVVEPAEIASNARIIHEQGERMTRIIRQLLDFSRKGGSRQRGLVDLRETARQTLALLGSHAEKRKVALRMDDEDERPAWARIDQEQIKQVLANLVMNGIQAMPGGGRVTVSAGRGTLQPPPAIGRAAGLFAWVEVVDEGCGIPPESVPRIFDPFYTTKEVGEGTGLGLSVSHGIIREHEGWIEVSSEPGVGTAFRICLPSEEEPCVAAS
jgi:two-component system, NtrC family, sensor kinase